MELPHQARQPDAGKPDGFVFTKLITHSLQHQHRVDDCQWSSKSLHDRYEVVVPSDRSESAPGNHSERGGRVNHLHPWVFPVRFHPYKTHVVGMIYRPIKRYISCYFYGVYYVDMMSFL